MSISALTLTGSNHQYGLLAFGSVTGTSLGAANTVLTSDRKRRSIQISNSLNGDAVIAIAGANFLLVRSGSDARIDLNAMGLCLDASVVVAVYCPGGAPASGNLGITLL